MNIFWLCCKNKFLSSVPYLNLLITAPTPQYNIFEYRTKGAIIRSKSQWYNEGEKNSGYFLNLEKRLCKQGTISQLKINDTDFVTTDRDILSECTAFYKNLYTSKSPDSIQSTFLSEVNFISLTNEEQTLCEGP